MIYFLMFCGIILSIVKANGWIIVPTFCVVFCWITSFFCGIIYSYARGLGEEISKKMKQDKIEDNKEVK